MLTAGPVGEGMPSCPVQLMRSFLADPSAPLPVECTEQVLHPSFDAPPDLATRYFGTGDIYD